MRRIGVLTGSTETDPEIHARYAARRQALQQLGWTEAGNVRIEYRRGHRYANGKAQP
jgi:hypothetical protein